MRRIPLLLLLACGAWAFVPTLRALAAQWMHDPQYSHGPLIPPVAGWLAWQRRREFFECESRPAWFSGLLTIMLTFPARAAAAVFDFPPLDGFALILVLVSCILVTCGWSALRIVSPAIAFLMFALPLPYSFETWLGRDLQHLATLGSTYLLQCFGQPAINEGNVILIGEIQLGVVEACSGLRMLLAFAAFATGITLAIDRSIATKAVLIASSVPIALIVNILRIAATGLAHIYLQNGVDSGKTLEFVHDLNGWLMMPIALLLFTIELKILNWLLVEPALRDRVISFPVNFNERQAGRRSSLQL